MLKTWNARDHTENELERLLLTKYSEIEKSYKLLRKIANLEDANKMIQDIFKMKSFCNQIEIELYKRRIEDEASS